MGEYMKKSVKIVLGAVLAAAAAGAAGMCGMAYYVHAHSGENGRISQHVAIGRVVSAGASEQEAERRIRAYVDGLQDEAVTLQAGNKKIQTTAGDLGLTWKNTDVVKQAVSYGKTGSLFTRFRQIRSLKDGKKIYPIVLASDPDRVERVIARAGSRLTAKAVNYRLDEKEGSLTVAGGKKGWSIDTAGSAEAVDDCFANGWKDHPSVQLKTVTIQPKGSREELSKIKDVLGKFSTDYSSSPSGRKANLANGAKKINGTLVEPGETFSVYEACQPFTKENGYEIAHAFENGTTVDSVGGGICQVSTTLYNAVIRAELEIVERSGHSMRVHYVDASADAAIAGTSKDMKFRNNQKNPIYISGKTDGSTITFTVYGVETRPKNRKISFESQITGILPSTTKLVASGAPVGSVSLTSGGSSGATARLWKVVKVNGKVKSRTQFNSTTYRSTPSTYAVGTASSNPQASSAMRAAVSSQSLSAARAAAARWRNVPVQKPDTDPKKNTDKNAGKKPADSKKDSKSADSGKKISDSKETSGKKTSGSSSSGKKSADSGKASGKKAA
jgi:vancomycin resistance protein YoaR